MALLRSPRFSHAVTACVLGVLACGASLTLAGSTPTSPLDPIDELPEGVELGHEVACATDLYTSVIPTTTTEAVGPTHPRSCWRFAVVRSESETGNELADRLAQHFRTRGFELNGPTAGDVRSYLGTLEVCGTALAIDTGMAAVTMPPGSRSTLPPTVDPAQADPTTDPSLPGAGGVPGVAGAGDPGTGTPATGDATGGTPNGEAPPVADPNVTPTSPGIDLTFVPDPLRRHVAELNAPTQKPGTAVVAVRQTYAVVPKAAADRC